MQVQDNRWDFQRVETVNHQGKALVIAEVKSLSHEAGEPLFLYNILDLEQQAQAEESAWDDEKQWRGFRPLNFPDEVRCAGMSLVTVAAAPLQSSRAHLRDWHVVTDTNHLFLFQAREAENGESSLFANRFVMVREAGTADQEMGPLSLQLKTEARYVRSKMRETPENQKDTPGIQRPDGGFFVEPTMHFTMLRPESGRFAVTLLPSDLPGKSRWQFFLPHPGKRIAAYSFLRDENGWVDLSKNKLSQDLPRVIQPDQIFSIHHRDAGLLEMAGRPAALLFQRQEQSTTARGTEAKGLTAPRLMLACLMRAEAGADSADPEMVVVDFALSSAGLPTISPTLQIGDIEPAKTALNFDEDLVIFPEAVPSPEQAFTCALWVRHLGGSGLLLHRGDLDEAASEGGFQVTWDAEQANLRGLFKLIKEGDESVSVEVIAPAPTSFVWHHVALTFASTTEGTQLEIFIDGQRAGVHQADDPQLQFNATGPMVLGGPQRDEESYGLGTDSVDFFTGDVDEFSLWNVRLDIESQNIYHPIKDPESQSALLGYWQFNDAHQGDEFVLQDASAHKNDGTIYGARWITDTAPVSASDCQEQGDLSTGMGRLQVPHFQNFTDPALRTSADGLIHLYTTGQDDERRGQLLVAQYDSQIARAQFSLGWVAGEASGSMLLVSRQPGSAANGLKIESRDHDLPLVDLEVNHGEAQKELWLALPNHVPGIVSVLNGTASGDAQDPEVQSGSKVFYDYAGMNSLIPLATESAGDPLLLLSNQPGALASLLPLTSAALAETESLHTLSLQMLAQPSKRDDGDVERGWPFMLAYDAFPVEITAALQRLGGHAPAPHFQGVLSRLALGAGALYFAGPATLTGIEIVIEDDPQDPTKAQAALTLVKEAERELVLWPGLPRAPMEIVEILNLRHKTYAYSPAMKKMAESLVVLAVNAFQAVANGSAQIISSGQPFESAALLKTVPNGAMGNLLGGTTQSAIRQGVVHDGIEHPDPTRSHFFKAAFFNMPTNGIKARLLEGPGVLHQPGNFGGWVPEPPSVAGYFDETEGVTLAQRSLENPNSHNLIPSGDFTMETWVQLDESGRCERPRIMTVHGDESQPEARFLLGLDRVEALFLDRNSSGMTAETADTRLDGQAGFSFTFWIQLPSASDQRGQVLQLGSEDNSHALNVDVSLRFLTVKFGPSDDLDKRRSHLTLRLPDALQGTWQFVTCTVEPWTGSEPFRTSIFLNDLSESTTLEPMRVEPLQVLRLGAILEKTQPESLDEKGGRCAVASIGVWDRVLRHEEIAPLRLNGGPGSDGLFAYWNFSLEEEGKIPNAVPDGPEWEGDLKTPRFVQGPGFHVVAGAGSRLVTSVTHPVQAGTWVHLAAMAENNAALGFDGTAYASVKQSDGLSPGKAFSLDAVFRQDRRNGQGQPAYLVAKSDILGKDASYCLGLLPDGRVQWQFWVKTPEGVRRFEVISAKPVEPGRAYYVAAGAALETEGNSSSDIKTKLKADLYLYDTVDGLEDRIVVSPTTWTENAETVAFQRSSARLVMGCLSDAAEAGSSRGELGFFKGVIGTVRYWNRLLGDDAKELAKFPGVPPSLPGPAGFWACREGQGLEVADVAGGQHATLVRPTMWQTSRLTTNFTLLVNGQQTQAEPLAMSDYEGRKSYGDGNLMSVGALQVGGLAGHSLYGKLDELRLWQGLRTTEEILDFKNTPLRGNENNLLGYWHFSIGSGRFIKDGTAWGNHLAISDATTDEFWQSSTAPISNESPAFLNLLAGVASDELESEGASPVAVEYGDMQEDSTGHQRGVLKRCYAYLKMGEDGRNSCILETGFGLGELDLRFIGQVQTKPTLIGFIEGAPPVPSENLTRPYYLSPTNPAYQAYDGVASVSLSEAQETTTVYSAERSLGFQLSISGKAGVKFEDESEAGTGVGYMQKITKLEGAAQLVGNKNRNQETSSGAELGTGSGKQRLHEMAAGGDWEERDAPHDETAERRYIPENVGSALVKSSVADLYALELKKTGTLIDMQIVADPNTPEDYNIIMFPIASNYTKQGCLDGKVGLNNDPDFPCADQERSSYFKPDEVANLKAQIAAFEADLEADYRSYDPGSAMSLANAQASVTTGIKQAFDFQTNKNLRNMVNTYVWTADGGFFAEEQQSMVSRSEFSGAAFESAIEGGASAEGGITFVGPGIGFEVEALLGKTLSTTATKSREESRNFEMGVDLEVESFLQKYLHSEGQFDGKSTPGKVAAYRFHSFYLAPEASHHQAFFDQVVQQDWLQFSNQPEAVALREARAQANSVWRVMHRVSYVNRVPREFGETPTLPPRSPFRSVIYQDANWEIIQRVLQALPVGRPTPQAIGAAVSAVFEEFKDTITWWPSWLAEAENDHSSQACKDYMQLRQAILSYMLALFEAGAANVNTLQLGAASSSLGAR